MTRPLEGRVALVTGARFGIGQAIATALGRAGASVAVTSRSGDDLTACVAQVEAEGSEAVPLAVELRDRASVDGAVDSVLARFGHLDVVVNNAAAAIRKPVEEFDDDEWNQVIDTNLGGVFRVVRAVAPVLASAGGGRIVNISSTYARNAAPGRVAYGASKAAIEQLTRALAVEWGPRHITVNAVAPTLVLTPSRQHLLDDPNFLPTRLAEIPFGRLPEPDDVAQAVVFLAGPGGSFVTGNTLVLDGGLTLW